MYYKTAFRGYQIKKYNIETCFVCPEGPKARGNKTGLDFMIYFYYIRGKLSNTMLYMIIHYGREPVLIHWILIGLKGILRYDYLIQSKV